MADSETKRECGSCSVCCSFFPVPSIDKPKRTPCKYLTEAGHGCGVYNLAPTMCQDYRCSWLKGAGDTYSRPDLSNTLIDHRVTKFGKVLVARPLQPDMEIDRKAIKRFCDDTNLLCLIVKYDTSTEVVDVIGTEEQVEEFYGKTDRLPNIA